MVSIRLNEDEEAKLTEAMAYCGVSEKSKFIKQLIHERWLALQSGKTFLERMGAPPAHLLSGPVNLSSRATRKRLMAEHLRARAKRRDK